MRRENEHLRVFGNLRLDVAKKVLWHGEEPVQLPLKAVELLSLLVERGGEVVTKEEIWQSVWQDAFVEETNLTHNIYLLRKTLKDLGEPDLIRTVPRRGYRFAGAVRKVETGDDEIDDTENRRAAQTFIEDFSEPGAAAAPPPPPPSTGGAASADSPRPAPRGFSSRPRGGARSLTLAAALLLAVLLLLLGGFAALRYQNSQTKRSLAEIKSIAVLPLRSLIDEESGKALGLGLTDALIARLGELQKINVRSMSAVKRYADFDKDALAAGRELNTDAVLDGTIQHSDGRLRVTVRLLNVGDGEQFWAGKFDESEADIFKLQDSISEQIAESLALNFNRADPSGPPRRRPTENPEAYQAYLRGRFHFDKRSKDDFKLSVEYFKLALEKDPNYALAHAGLADIYALMASTEVRPPRRNELYRQAAQAAEKALAIDERLADAHASLGSIKRTHQWDWEGAERYFRRALELNPESVNARQWYALLLVTLDRKEEAVAEIDRAIRLDALSSIVLRNAIAVHHQTRRYDEALDALQKALELDPSTKKELIFTRARIYLAQEKYQEAIAEIEGGSPPEQIKEHSRTMFPLAVAYQRAGQTGRAEEYVKEMEKRVERGDATAYWLALVYANNGAADKAFGLLEQCYEARDERLTNLKTEPALDPLRGDARFEAILRKMNLR